MEKRKSHGSVVGVKYFACGLKKINVSFTRQFLF